MEFTALVQLNATRLRWNILPNFSQISDNIVRVIRVAVPKCAMKIPDAHLYTRIEFSRLPCCQLPCTVHRTLVGTAIMDRLICKLVRFPRRHSALRDGDG